MALAFQSPIRGYGAELDPTFSVGTGTKGSIYAIAVQANGAVLLGGYFIEFAGSSNIALVRLHPDGRLDSSFTSPFRSHSEVLSLELMADGRILAAGRFDRVGVRTNQSAVRLLPDGTLDPGFTPNISNSLSWRITAKTPDQIYVLGDTETVKLSGDGRRLAADVSVRARDTIGNGYLPVYSYPYGGLVSLRKTPLFGVGDPGWTVLLPGIYRLDLVAPQEDGAVFVGGQNALLRLLSDGNLDPSFKPPVFHGAVGSIEIGDDNRLWVGGGFDAVNGFTYNGLVRLLPDGNLDFDFNPGNGLRFADNSVGAVNSIIRLSPDQLLVAGAFASYDETPAAGAARLNVFGEASALRMASATYSVDEWAQKLQVQILRLGSITNGTSVELRTVEGGALAGLDFETTSRTIIFQPGERLKTMEIPILDDTTNEPLESFSVMLANPADPSILVRPYQTGVTIRGIDTTLQFLQDEYQASEGQANWVTVQVSGFGWQEFDFYLVPSNGTAIANQDFPDRAFKGVFPQGFHGGPVTFEPQTVVGIIDDGLFEVDEHFTLSITSSAPWVNILGRTNLKVTIHDDDNPLGPNPGPNQSLEWAALLPNGKYLIQGGFTLVDGARRRRLARLDGSGRIDVSFSIPDGLLPYGRPLVQPDGKIITPTNGLRNNLARLNSDGSLDFTFVAPRDAVPLMVQEDGGILVTSTNGAPPPYNPRVLRLLTNGQLDESFSLPGGLGIARPLLSDAASSKSLVLAFSSYRLVVVTPTGLIIEGRIPQEYTNATMAFRLADSSITYLALRTPDEGFFYELARYSILGQPDPNFSVNRFNLGTYAAFFRLTESGKILLYMNGRLSMIGSDGRRDPTFQEVVFDNLVNDMFVLPDERTLAVGRFNSVNGMARRFIAIIDTSGRLLEPVTLSIYPRSNSAVSQLKLVYPVLNNTSLEVEESLDLKTWKTVWTNQGPSDLREFQITEPLKFSSKFFRIRPVN